MTVPTETPPPAVVSLVAGHFRETPSYSAWRRGGTDSWLLVYTLAGGGRFGYDGGELRTTPGQVVLVRPGTRHDYGTAPPAAEWELLWVHFHPRPHWQEWLAWPEVAAGLMTLTLREPVIRQQVRTRFVETYRMASGAFKAREGFAMNALEAVLLWCGTQNPRSDQAWLDERVRGCMDFLCQNLASQITLSDLADRAGLSVSRLAHLFRAQVGMPPQQFLEKQRLERARQLLEWSGRGIGDIAADVGFENPFYFSLRFKRRMGLSPRDYRKSLSQR